tara:strand:+ start:610 stop:786 length:177 start_codon:yes stop_codon:yes gene_type:complete
MINITVHLAKRTEAGDSKLYLTLTESEFKKIKKDSIKHNKYSNSYDMPNGDIVEVIND